MQPTDFQRFATLMRGMGRIFSSDLDNAVMDVYWITLREWSMKDFEGAVAHLMASAQFMPRPADFTNLRKASKPTAAEAWATVLKRCLNWRNAIENPDVIDRAVAGIGGYRAIAMADTEQSLPHFQHKFLVAYNELDGAVTVREALPNLAPAPGINARDGKFTGIAAPVLGRELVPTKGAAR